MKQLKNNTRFNIIVSISSLKSLHKKIRGREQQKSRERRNVNGKYFRILSGRKPGCLFKAHKQNHPMDADWNILSCLMFIIFWSTFHSVVTIVLEWPSLFNAPQPYTLVSFPPVHVSHKLKCTVLSCNFRIFKCFVINKILIFVCLKSYPNPVVQT